MLKFNGVQLSSGTDSNALTTGTVAMYTWMNTGAQFDNVLVRNLGVPFSSVAPPARTPEPEPMPPPDPTRLAMLMPSHTDRSRGDRSAS